MTNQIRKTIRQARKEFDAATPAQRSRWTGELEKAAAVDGFWADILRVESPRASGRRLSRVLRETIRGQLGIEIDVDDMRDLRLMLLDNDEGSLLGFFTDRIDGGLTRDGCIAVSNLVANFGGGVEDDGAEARRALTQHTTDELADPTTEGDRRREIDAEDVGACGRDDCAGYKPDGNHELAF